MKLTALLAKIEARRMALANAQFTCSVYMAILLMASHSAPFSAFLKPF
jgi:hypothetical protein